MTGCKLKCTWIIDTIIDQVSTDFKGFKTFKFHSKIRNQEKITREILVC